MKKHLKAIKFSLYLLLLLYVTAYAIARHSIATDRFKKTVQNSLMKVSGSRIRINGRIQLQGFPVPTIVATNVVVENPNDSRWDSTPYLAHFNHVDLSPYISSVFKHALKIKYLKVNGATLFLDNSQDQSNWAELLQHIKIRQHNRNTKANKTAVAHSLFPIQISNASLTVLSDNNAKYTFNHIQLHFTPINKTKQIKLSLHSYLTQEHLNTRIPLTALATISNNNGQYRVLSGRVHMGDLIAKLSPASALTHKGTASYSKVVIPPFHFYHLASSLGVHLPGKKSAWNTLSADFNLAFKPSVTTLSNIAVRLGDNKLNGNAYFYSSAGSSAFNFTLQANTLEAGPLLFSGVTPTSSSNINTVIHSFPSWNVTGNIKIANLLIDGLDFHPVNAHVTLKKNILKVSPLTFNFEKGKVSLSGIFIPEDHQLKIINNISITSLPLAPLLQQFTSYSNVSGKLNMQALHETTGSNWQTWISHLQGQGQITINDGAVKGFDIPYYLKQAEAIIGTPSLKNVNNHETQFNQIKGHYEVNNGIFTENKFAVKIGHYLLNATGTTNLLNSQIHYQLSATNQNNQRQWMIPLTLAGTWQQPKIGFDKQGVIKNFFHRNANQTAAPNRSPSLLARIKGLL